MIEDEGARVIKGMNPKAQASSPVSSVFATRRGEWDWQAHAACTGMDVSVFFGDAQEPMTLRRRREARGRAVCGVCPVQRRCLQFALRHRIRDGLWGGLDEDQRARLLRHLNVENLTR